MDSNNYENELKNNSYTDLKYFTLNEYVTKCKVVNVHDGDTISIVFYLNGVPMKTHFRMLGYDAPEIKPIKTIENYDLHKKAGIVVQQIIEKKLLGNIFWIKFCKEEKYGRTMGEIYELCDNADSEKSINKWMIDNKCGKKYDGGKKEIFNKEELEHIIAKFC